MDMPHVQITWVEGRTPEQKRKIAERVTNVLIEDGKAKRENIHVSFHDLPSTNYAEAGVLAVDQKRTRGVIVEQEKSRRAAPPTNRGKARPSPGLAELARRARVAADERPIEKITDADRERNDAERGNRPDITIRLDARNQSESSDVTDGSADQQDSRAAGKRRLVQFRLHRNVDFG